MARVLNGVVGLLTGAGVALAVGWAAGAVEAPGAAAPGASPRAPEGAPPAPVVRAILETLEADPNFSSLVGAVRTAGLVEELSGKGPFTVFAPTNAAFEKLGKERLEELLRPANRGELQGVLKFHVIPRALRAAEVVRVRQSPPTLQGASFTISVRDKSVMIGNEKGMATIVRTDIECANGIIHVIDSVITPPDPRPADPPRDTGRRRP
jgi:uncharacterized surface protein with fasciclin (FAS1) repeats